MYDGWGEVFGVVVESYLFENEVVMIELEGVGVVLLGLVGNLVFEKGSIFYKEG